MSTTSRETSNEVSKKKDQDGFWASQSPADQKKYTLVFLVSLGTTLLVTGRSGGSLLKRAKKSEASAPPTPCSKPTTVVNHKLFKKKNKNTQPLSFPSPSSSSTSLQTPPTSYLHPNSLSIPQTLSSPRNSRSRRLLPSFLVPPSSSSSLEPPAPSSYFLPNTLLTSHSTAYAKELDRQDKLHEDGLTPEQELAERDRQIDDGFNPAVYAMKALGIATLITFTGFGLSIFGLMKWLGVKNVRKTLSPFFILPFV